MLKQSVGIRRRGLFLWLSNDVDFRDFANTVKDGVGDIEISFRINHFGIGSHDDPKVSMVVNLVVSQLKENFDYLKKLSFAFEDQSIEINIDQRRNSGIVINGQDYSKNIGKVIASVTGNFLPELRFLDDCSIIGDSSDWVRKELEKLDVTTSERRSRYKHMILNVTLKSRENTIEMFRRTAPVGDERFNINLKHLNDMYYLLHVNDIIEAVNRYLFNLSMQMSYIRPLRATIDRYYRFQNYSVDEIDSDGKNLSMYLSSLDEATFMKFREWTYKLFGFKIYINAPEHSGHVEIQIEEAGRARRNMVDVGFGYTQMLPMITMIWKAQFGRRYFYPNSGKSVKLIVVEQPELHLHPRYQGLFAAMLARVIAENKQQQSHMKSEIRFIIETHSEVMVRRIGELIADEKLDRNDVNVVLFNASSEGVTENYVSSAEFTESGYLKNWPLGFFSDNVYRD